MKGQVFRTLRESIHHTVTRSGIPMKAIAAELDMSPSTLSMATTLGDDNARAFPADDAHLVKLIEITGDASILMTLADRLGYELRPKPQKAAAELLEEVRDGLRTFMPLVQQVLEIDGQKLGRETAAPARRARR